MGPLPYKHGDYKRAAQIYVGFVVVCALAAVGLGYAIGKYFPCVG